MNKQSYLINIILAGGLLSLVSCAGSSPSAKFTQKIPSSSLVTSGDRVQIQVDNADSVTIEQHQKARVRGTISKKLDAQKSKHPSTGTPRSLTAVVHLTEYNEGNAFARAMLAGLGKIKIKSTVALYEQTPRKKIGEFQLNKTFAWGGMYGGFTSMESVEDGFADGVANALTKAN